MMGPWRYLSVSIRLRPLGAVTYHWRLSVTGIEGFQSESSSKEKFRLGLLLARLFQEEEGSKEDFVQGTYEISFRASKGYTWDFPWHAGLTQSTEDDSLRSRRTGRYSSNHLPSLQDIFRAISKSFLAISVGLENIQFWSISNIGKEGDDGCQERTQAHSYIAICPIGFPFSLQL